MPVPKIEVIVIDGILPRDCQVPFVVELRRPMPGSITSEEDITQEQKTYIAEPNNHKAAAVPAITGLSDGAVKKAMKTDASPNSADEAANKEIAGLIFEDRETSQADMNICKLCFKIFENQYKLDSHLFRVHKIEKFPKKMGRNKRTHISGGDWPPNVQELARRVQGVKTFFCNLCSYRVTRSDSMTKHLSRIHSEGRVVAQYQCEVCGKTFTDKSYLRNHGVSHVTEKQYTCEVCGQGFHRQSSLKRHRQIHQESKQFACLLCDYKSNRKQLMYKHAEYHRTGRSYHCKFCGQQFFTQISFRSHIYTHNASPNSCSFCKVGFSSRERMMSHMKRVHYACEIKDILEEKDFMLLKTPSKYI